ncbi:helix-turn-helix domain-containing protein [Streptomyces flaveolus]|uniref:helix-turn-helix domain-containing protein n=1 Tax=Streptomyces flaveolus TaxID=67297 RepID=UPI003F4D7082
MRRPHAYPGQRRTARVGRGTSPGPSGGRWRLNRVAVVIRAVYAGMRTLPVPGAPVARLWHSVTMLREHRGDGHVAALVGARIGGTDELAAPPYETLRAPGSRTSDSLSAATSSSPRTKWPSSLRPPRVPPQLCPVASAAPPPARGRARCHGTRDLPARLDGKPSAKRCSARDRGAGRPSPSGPRPRRACP